MWDNKDLLIIIDTCQLVLYDVTDMRVPVINMEDGSMLTGDEAPKKRHLEQWLLEHPGYLVSGQAATAFPLPLPLPDDTPPHPPPLHIPDIQAVSTRRDTFFFFNG
jgi:hypothetical protein